jgi:hypothetical protein
VVATVRTVVVADATYCGSVAAARDESGVDNFRIRSDPNLNYANVEKSF